MTKGEKGEPIQSTGTAFANIGVIVIDDASKKIESNSLYRDQGRHRQGRDRCRRRADDR